MYRKQNLTYVLTMLEAIEKIFLYTQDIKDADDFFTKNHQMPFNACQTLLLLIGEEVRKIDEGLEAEHPEIPWHLIIGLRNRIAYDYRSIDPNISYDIVINYLPALKQTLIEMIPKIEFEDELMERILSSDFYQNIGYLRDKGSRRK